MVTITPEIIDAATEAMLDHLERENADRDVYSGPMPRAQYRESFRGFATAMLSAAVPLLQPQSVDDAGRESLAKLVEQLITDRYFGKIAPTRVALAVAANAVRRGRHLTDDEKNENLAAAIREYDAERQTKGKP